jgi:hypothetical protein
MNARALLVGLLLILPAFPASAQKPTREQKVREDRKKVEADGFWIYGDLEKGFAQAKQTGKPMIVILRCIPCEECVKLDDDLVNQDQRVRPLLEKFVRVRIVSTNGLDLTRFQYDFDQSFAAMFFNADGTIYGRFGTRSHRTSWASDVSIEGLAKALQGVLEIHSQYPKNKESLAAKKGAPLEVASPEKFPLLKDRYTATLNYEGNVVQSCIHCHQIGDAQKAYYFKQKKPVPEQILFPYPHPKTQGLILDPKERSTLLEVEKDSAAEKAGFKKSDVILALNGQPIVSIADVQWVLHHTLGAGATIQAEVQRGQEQRKLEMKLEKGWRERENLSWRVSTWGLRRKTTGGLFLVPLTAEEREKMGLKAEDMALRTTNAPQLAAVAGFAAGDILVSFDGKSFPRETDLIAYAINERKTGDKVTVSIIRNGKKMEITYAIPE